MIDTLNVSNNNNNWYSSIVRGEKTALVDFCHLRLREIVTGSFFALMVCYFIIRFYCLSYYCLSYFSCV